MPQAKRKLNVKLKEKEHTKHVEEEVEGIKDIKFSSLIFSLYIYTKI